MKDTKQIQENKREKAKVRDGIKPCSECGENRWKTTIKHKKYVCRNCGHIRTLRPKKNV